MQKAYQVKLHTPQTSQGMKARKSQKPHITMYTAHTHNEALYASKSAHRRHSSPHTPPIAQTDSPTQPNTQNRTTHKHTSDGALLSEVNTEPHKLQTTKYPNCTRHIRKRPNTERKQHTGNTRSKRHTLPCTLSQQITDIRAENAQ